MLESLNIPKSPYVRAFATRRNQPLLNSFRMTRIQPGPRLNQALQRDGTYMSHLTLTTSPL